MSFLFVLSTAIILLFVLFTLYYYIASKKEVPHHVCHSIVTLYK
ncbi:ABC transporter ATP-binding protein [Bacillus sp. WL1]|nr:ABC transporter ATP-binding protein [Bacillus sp. WL1]MBP3970125.1 ABC transporter ATP-binding protein [Bacillus sp. WL1]